MSKTSAASACPVAHDQQTPDATAAPLSNACPVAHGAAKSDVPDTQLKTVDNKPIPNVCPSHWSRIPSADGRGNADDGNWENPSPRQLYAALKRKNKAGDLEEAGLIDADVVRSVADAHAKVTRLAWEGVLEFENMHKPCKPQLVRFVGNPEYTIKARVWNALGYELPFDRHDWYIDRCGVEKKYIIDFYSVSGDESAMLIDARPAVTFDGIIDRVRLAGKKLKAMLFG